MTDISPEQIRYLNQIKRHVYIVRTARIFILFGFLILWELAADTGIIDSFIFSSPSKIVRCFREMREKRDYFAVVLDEYGCFVGIVTLHDLVETLVGDIDDRTDLPKPDEKEYLMQMDGREVFMFAVKSVPQAVKEVLEKNNVAQEEISFYILHQANKRIVEAIAKRLGEPLEKFPMNLEEYGNTSSASIPILLDELNRAGKLQKGQKIILAGFGAGLTWGASILEW